MQRILLVCDRSDHWYIRRVAHNAETDTEMRYYCDQHLGGPYLFEHALSLLRIIREEAKKEPGVR